MHQRYRQTDYVRTDDDSDREREFTFAKNYNENYYVQCCVLLCILDLGLVTVTVCNAYRILITSQNVNGYTYNIVHLLGKDVNVNG